MELSTVGCQLLKLFQEFWKKFVSKILEENLLKILEEICFKDF